MMVLPSEPVTFSVTTAATVRPTVSVLELIESSRAACISVPLGSVRPARAVATAPESGAGVGGGAVSGTTIESARADEAVEGAEAVSAVLLVTVSGVEATAGSGARVVVSAGAATVSLTEAPLVGLGA